MMVLIKFVSNANIPAKHVQRLHLVLIVILCFLESLMLQIPFVLVKLNITSPQLLCHVCLAYTHVQPAQLAIDAWLVLQVILDFLILQQHNVNVKLDIMMMVLTNYVMLVYMIVWHAQIIPHAQLVTLLLTFVYLMQLHQDVTVSNIIIKILRPTHLYVPAVITVV